MVSGIPQVLPTTVYKWGTFREEDSLLDNQHNGSKNNCLYLIAGVRVAGGFESLSGTDIYWLIKKFNQLLAKLPPNAKENKDFFCYEL
jgi:hypothetical protein